MSELDIRTQSVTDITTIRIADCSDNTVIAELIVKDFDGVSIADSSGDGLVIFSVEHARNLIKGLEKVIQIGWFKE